MRKKAENATRGSHGIVPGSPFADALDVCMAYLREHPADDDEPVTAAWLRTLDDLWNEHGWGIEIEPDGRVNLMCLDDESPSDFGGCLTIVKTRRDVRTLCKALGIELK